MWVLLLNDMRNAHVEDLRPYAKATTKTILEEYVASLTVEDYVDNGERSVVHDTDSVAMNAERIVVDAPAPYKWHKTFRKDSPLEWCNPPSNDDNYLFINSLEELKARALLLVELEYSRTFGSVPEIGGPCYGV